MSDQSLWNDYPRPHGFLQPLSSCEGQEPWVVRAHDQSRCAPDLAIREAYGVMPCLRRSVVTSGTTSFGAMQNTDSPSIVMLDLMPVESSRVTRRDNPLDISPTHLANPFESIMKIFCGLCLSNFWLN